MMERAFFSDRKNSVNDPAYLEWQEVRLAIANHGLPQTSSPDEKLYSLRQTWNLLTRPLAQRTTSIVRSAPDQPGVAALHREQINATLMNRAFILPMPEWFDDAITSDDYLAVRYDCHEAVDLRGGTDLAAFYDAVPVRGFRQIVEYHSEVHARELLAVLRDRPTYPPYNKKKVGLHGYQQSQRRGQHEGVYLDLDFYETDYNTHRVMKRVLHDLRTSHPDLFPDDPAPYDAAPYLRYFTTSFGVNILVTTREQRGRRFYMALLSNRQGNINQQGLWHVSANEGISLEDVMHQRVDMGEVVSRALLEELGANYAEPDDETHFLEFAIDRRNLEPFLSCVVHLSADRETFYRRKQHMARDDRREFQDVRDFPFSEQAIVQMLIEEPRGINGFTSYCLNILDSILVRNLAPRIHE